MAASPSAGPSKYLFPVVLLALLGAGLGFVNASGLLAPWARLPAPPEAGVRIGSASSAQLILASASGQQYLYRRASAGWDPLTDQQAAAYPNLALASPASDSRRKPTAARPAAGQSSTGADVTCP